MLTIHVHYGRKVQVVRFEDSIEYGISVSDEAKDDESPEAHAARVQRLAARFFNAVELGVLADHDIVEERNVSLSLMEGEDDTTPAAKAESSTSRPPPRRRRR